jgi:PIN domain nuclease of toxin-antitoxin system
VNILLDTHAFLWAISDSAKLSSTARQCFLDPENRLVFSAASMWEIAIKQSIGKLSGPRPIVDLVREELRINGTSWLGIEPEHCQHVAGLPFHHRDPFDRMLVSQAIRESLQVLSADTELDAYDVKRIW